MFVLFRHVEIRKVEAHNQTSTPDNPPKSHSKRDDIIICLLVLAVLVCLSIFMNESQGWRWASIIFSYLLIVLISSAVLVRGSSMPSLIKERKWEYLALFSILIFWAGAAISTIAYAVLKMKLGDTSVVPAKIVGYEEYEYNDDDNGEEDNEEDDDEDNEDNEEDQEDEENDDEEEENEEENEENNDEEDDNEEENEENDNDGRRKLEDEGDNEEGDDDKSESHDSSDDEGAQAAYIKVAYGGSWGCPGNANAQCITEVETSCELWDANDESSQYYGATETWKYGSGTDDSRLDDVFSCANGFEDDENYNGDDDNTDFSQSPIYSQDGTPYGYIIGNCKTCEAKWAWTPLYRQHDSLNGYNSLRHSYVFMSVASVFLWFLATIIRTSRSQAKKSTKSKKAKLLPNSGGVSV